MATKIIAISGDGNGAGKSTMARSLVGEHRIISLASVMRQELTDKYPKYDWFNKAQEYKEGTLVTEEGNKTVRQVLIDYGQEKCKDDPWYWVRILCLKAQGRDGVFAIDDLRKMVEIELLRGFFGPTNVCHIHVAFAGAKAEALYDNDKLRAVADYVFPRGMVAMPAAHVPSHTDRKWFVIGVSSGARYAGPFVSRELAEKAYLSRLVGFRIEEQEV